MKQVIIIFFSLTLISANLYAQEADSSFYSEVESGYINLDKGKLFYEIAGKGNYVVLLHDGILHRVIWDDQFYVLAKKYRVIRYDRRGFSKSSAPKEPFSHVEDLNKLFTQLKIDEAIVLGMSAGGSIAINFALEYPEKVEALVLAGAVVSGYGYSEHFLTRGGHIKSLLDYMDPEKFIKYFGLEDPYEIYPPNIKAKEKFYDLLKANHKNVQGALAYFVKPPKKQSYKFLNEIKVPTLILVGEYDIPDVHSHAGVIEAGIPNAKREIISNSGHLIPLEQPEAFNVSVIKFLNKIEFLKILNLQEVEAAVQHFYKKRQEETSIVLFDEVEMNVLGYSYLQKGKTKDAIEIFKLNTITYPNSSDVYDSLGEAYIKDNNKELAIKNYEKSLELNPSNENAKEMSKQLRLKCL